MGTAERRNEILKILCRRRHETIQNMASEFGVSERTIRRDVEVLSLSYPVYTQSGRYSGGVYLVDGYSMDRMYMCKEEMELMRKVSDFADKTPDFFAEEEKELLHTMISRYTNPKIKL